jgi:hypothetical protein
MADETEAPARTGSFGFKSRRFQKRIEPAAAERQGRITLLAWNRLGADAAIAFLNGEDAELGGRPLDLAVASESGLEAVERAIAQRATTL